MKTHIKIPNSKLPIRTSTVNKIFGIGGCEKTNIKDPKIKAKDKLYFKIKRSGPSFLIRFMRSFCRLYLLFMNFTTL